MSINISLVNGLVFGISHNYQLDFDQVDFEGKEMSEVMALVPRVPVVFIHLGPLVIALSW